MKKRTKKHKSGIRYQNFNFNVLKKEISPDNVFAMSEIIAFMKTRYLISYAETRMQQLNTILFKDIKNRGDVSH